MADSSLTVVVAGASGHLGSALVALLQHQGHRVRRLVRSPRPSTLEAVPWNPEAGTIDAAALEGVDAVINLAGERIAAVRWTQAKKARIAGSRVGGTRLLAETLAALARRPRVFLSASAVGYYGDRGAEVLTEESPPGDTYLARLCREWEAAAEPARRAGIRVVHLRTANVLDARRGFLVPLLPLFRLGLGGRLGSGRQYMPWITIDDWVQAVGHLLTAETVDGPVNLAAPQPVTNAEFTRTLARVLGRPAFFVVPAFVLRLVMGELGREILASQRVYPARLLASGFTFRYPSLEEALHHLLR
ncbi:MAG: TIGR01777 family oxidoreductase [Armatimonadota bacterium]|nr:TIGR01777 family oxidoreductase [Armatimonadota bacterium]MDR7426998.1 TIGR01777 family oxidoreductase [Armatimonadota bacterium]MDR7463084.1 TIGR01777 family oxidoreductase [Armatimonadota bacterium]MDR7469333.1 TIGR01777 family oxidoreductase [Armatimonadota bacterium]MDR7539247.1 TIGR01777 family oxidoreductase [Armatimonadota bacterium]